MEWWFVELVPRVQMCWIVCGMRGYDAVRVLHYCSDLVASTPKIFDLFFILDGFGVVVVVR